MRNLHAEGLIGRMAGVGAILLTGLLGASALSGCLVAGYSSRGGAFLWPGGLGFLVILVLLFLVLRGRR